MKVVSRAFLMLASVALLASSGCKERDYNDGDDADTLAIARDMKNLKVLMFHDIIKDDFASNCRVPDDVTLPMFKKFLDYLKEHKIDTITAYDLVKAQSEGKTLQKKKVMITFDDNYHGVYQYAIPELVSRGMKATIFAHTAYVRQNGTPATNNCKVRAKSSWDEMVKMETELGGGKLFRFESHTHTHPNADGALLANLSKEKIRQELTVSKDLIEKNFKEILAKKNLKYCDAVGGAGHCTSTKDKRVVHLAYPRGSYNAKVAAEMKAAGYLRGYEVGYDEDYGSPQFDIPRVGIGLKITSVNSFASQLNPR